MSAELLDKLAAIHAESLAHAQDPNDADALARLEAAEREFAALLDELRTLLTRRDERGERVGALKKLFQTLRALADAGESEGIVEYVRAWGSEGAKNPVGRARTSCGRPGAGSATSDAPRVEPRPGLVYHARPASQRRRLARRGLLLKPDLAFDPSPPIVQRGYDVWAVEATALAAARASKRAWIPVRLVDMQRRPESCAS